jgi:hypothetical protein
VVGEVLAKDPFFQAIMSAWTLAANKGICLYRPSVEWAGARVVGGKLDRGHIVLLGDSLAWGAQTSRAMKVVRDCDQILASLADQVRRAEVAGGSARYKAMADLTRILLLLTRFNLLHYAAFCRETGPAWIDAEPEVTDPPEIPVLRPDLLYSRISFTSLALCHGLAPYREMRLPGGEALDREFADLNVEIDRFFVRQAHTPFAQVLRKQGIAKFHFVGTPKRGIMAPRWVPGVKAKKTTTPPPKRPARGGPSGGGSGGTTTPGGGK